MTTPARPGSFTGATDNAASGGLFTDTLIDGIPDIIGVDVTRAETAATNAEASATTATTQATSATASAATATTQATAASTDAASASASKTSATASQTAATASQTAAAASETAAGTSATNAAASQSAAASSATSAGSSNTTAAQSANSALSSASSASTSASTATTQATSATASATTATTQASSATTQAAAALVSKNAAAASETAALASKNAAAASETAAGTSETNAAASETAAETAETNAETAETNAETAETNAAASASAASTSASASLASKNAAAVSEAAALVSKNAAAASETAAGTSETNASTSATAASSSQTAAASSATTATQQATISTTKAGESAASSTSAASSQTASASSASAASSSQTAAATSATNAASSLTTFQGLFVASSSAPASPDVGDLWYDTTNSQLKVYVAGSPASWQIAGAYLQGLIANHTFTCTAGQTAFITDDASGTMSIDVAANVFAYLNGVKLIGSGTDYSISGNTITLTSGAIVSDVLYVDILTKISTTQETALNALVTQATAAKTAAETAETNAETAETNAATSATAAGTSATNAATSATNSSNSASSSATSATSSAGSLTSFNGIYRGESSTAPSSPTTGQLWYDTTNTAMKVYSGSAWTAAYVSGTGFLATTGGALTGAVTTTSTFDGRDVAADGATADAALPKAGGAMTGAITTNSTIDGRDVSVDGTKLDTIEASADVTDATNVTAAGALMDSEVTNLAQVKAFDSSDYATAAQGTLAAAALPKSGGAMTGAITTNSTFDGRDVATDGTKLDGIEASADVTDATNVTAAGALMDSEITNLAQVKAFNSSAYATSAQGTLATNALPKAGGAMTGAITTNSTFDGRDVATDGTKLDGIEASANVTDTANVTAAGALMKTGGTMTGILTTKVPNSTTVAAANDESLSIKGDLTKPAVMSFHRAGAYAVNFGLSTSNTLQLGGWSASTIKHTWNFSGDYIATGNITAYSDERVKENIEVIPEAINKVKQLNGYTFDRTDFVPDAETGVMPETRQTGVIAQEVIKVLPEAVMTMDDGKYAVAYGNMVGLLIEAIKEQQVQIDELKATIESKGVTS